MTTNEKQIQDTEVHYDQMMKQIEDFDPQILFSVVPGSRLQQHIYNPITEGIDKD
jgi:hypothetical protein